MVRVIFRLVGRRWSLLLLSVILLIGGLVGGFTSHQVSYIQSSSGVTYRINQGDQSHNVYIHSEGSDDYYVAFSSDFTVVQSDLTGTGSISFVARSDTSQLDPPLNAPDGSTIHDAHKIEKLTFADNNGQVTGTYTTDEYKANPNGFYENTWPTSILVIIAGLFFGGLGLYLFLRKKPQTSPAFNMGAGGAQPYQQPYAQPQYPYQPPQQPYIQPQQPYQGGPASYHQDALQQPPYGQQAGNPYQRPSQW